ncbi:HEAT repeat domain-containing protein [Aureibacter tunicatorum]|uniref:HEAT repeat domain-containing protein n=1 Tax=Aureibacter tunicatorum TaxID=866807 RepID=A0AAE3XNZ3_9BACT|nr:HEAT repeat domain-containing protein [Aureibacter tunicatorum]MDR6241416.1 hypothetical protein [Aureibacter tunicatorum]BDD06739.1 hypothetical protein AUTU_42220 [Aureibacter tunicatorum]
MKDQKKYEKAQEYLKKNGKAMKSSQNEQEFVGFHLNEKDDCMVEEELESLLSRRKAEKVMPSENLSMGFEAILDQEKDLQIVEENKFEANTVRRMPKLYYQMAASLLIFMMGYWSAVYFNNESEVESLRLDAITSIESPSDQLMHMYEIEENAEFNDRMLEVLLHTMNQAENSNVRYKALNAIINHYDSPKTKRIIANALMNEQDEQLQLEMINVLVKWKEKSALDALEHLYANEENDQMKEHLKSSISKISA